MENKNLYIFIGKIALEFRVSLDNICKMLGKEVTEGNKMNVYNSIISVTNPDNELKDMYNYLFFYETVREPENISKTSYARAVNYIKRYQKIKKEGSPEQVKDILSELNKTERDFFEIKQNIGKSPLTQKEAEIMEKYRIKHVLSRFTFCQNYGVTRSTLESREKNIEDPILKTKLDSLSEFFLQVSNDKLRKKGI